VRTLFLLLLVSTVGLGAQEPPPNAPPAPEQGFTLGEIQRIFDGYLVMQAQDALGLSDQQFAQFVPRLKVLQDTRRRYQQERMRLLNELQRLTRPAAGHPAPGDEGLIKERLNALQENEARSAADIRKAYTAIDELLDPRQQARFRIFEEQIERKKLDLLLRARQNLRQNPNRPMPKRPPL